MIFEEKKFISIEEYKKVFIYFLIKNDEVVYVGKTTQGIFRPLSHRNKDYDKINIIYCDVDKSDKLESYYILKYKPKYNKELNYNSFYTMNMVVQKIKREIDFNFNLWRLKSIIKETQINIQEFNGKKYISKDDFKEIIAYIRR